MKVLTKTKRSIISLNLTNLLAKIDFAITWFKCKRSSERKNLPSFLIHTFFLMSSLIFTVTITNLRVKNKAICGSLSLKTVLRARESI